MIVSLYLFASVISQSYQSLEHLFYRSIDIDAYCVRRFNGTHEFGCALSGSGILVPFGAYLTDNHYHNSSYPITILMTMSEFYSYDTSNMTLEHPNIKAVLVDASDKALFESASDDTPSPNCHDGIYNQSTDCHKWNPVGTKLFFTKYPFPVMMTSNKTQIEKLKSQCIESNKGKGHSRTAQYCHLQLAKDMNAAGTSQVCLRRNNIGHLINLDFSLYLNDKQFCIPTSQSNILSEIGSHPSSNPKVLLITRSDSLQFFPQIAAGYSSPGVGLLTTLLVSKYISCADVPITLAILNGESLGYSGSSYFQRHVNNRSYDAIIELGQLISSKSLYKHSYMNDSWSDEQKLRNRLLSESFLNQYFQKPVRAQQLPPCSIQAFLRSQAHSNVLIVDHDDQYKSPFVHSFLDQAPKEDTHRMREDVKRILEHARAIASSILRFTNSSTTVEDIRKNSFPNDGDFLLTIYRCMFHSLNCSLLVKLSSAFNYSINFENANKPMDFYVFGGDLTQLMIKLLVNYVSARGDYLRLNREQCLAVNGTFLVHNQTYSECLVTGNIRVFVADPNLLLQAYEKQAIPLWTESIENNVLVARYYMKSDLYNWLPFVLGLIVTFLPTPMLAYGAKRYRWTLL